MSSASSMRKFRCWGARSIGETIYPDIGALPEEADALFLAAHSPMELQHTKGAELVTGGSGESKVLAALMSGVGDETRNTLVAVTGSSGSGKSHVVRWVRAHIQDDESKFTVLYVPRAVQTLRDLLRRIIEGLPGVEGAALMQRVDSAISNVKPGEFQDRLVYEMKSALRWTIDDFPAEDGETAEATAAREDLNEILGVRDEHGARKYGLADLVELKAFSDALLRPEGNLRRLVESYFNETSRRDDNDEIFTREDLPLRSRGVSTELRRNHNRELEELWQIVAQQPDDAIRLLEEALRIALPKATGLKGLGGETLESLFLKSRQALRRQGRELVLIFEDLAQFGLVDGELYDQFATQPGADLAPLRVLFAITDAPYARMLRTVRTRITHEFRVGDTSLARPEEFVGRYLNLIRVGREQTQQLWNEHSGMDIDVAWMPNSCDTREEGQPCRFRAECHSSFGAVSIADLGEVGLYPYNHTALSRAMARLGDAPTPRKVMDECLSTILLEADVHIAQGDYPHDRTREQFDFKVRMGKDPLLEQFPSSDRERMYRALVIWGDEAPLPVGIQDAFSLDSTRDRGRPVQRPLDFPRPEDLSKERPKEESEKENRLLPLFQWQAGDDLPQAEADILRDTLCAFTTERLNLDQDRIHIYGGRGKALLDSLFNRTSFVIEGARGAGSGAIKFELKRTPEDMRLMVAARWFRDHGHFDPDLGDSKWPEGYDPEQLLVEFECRMDGWAAQVRRAFLARTGGSRLARHALGIRSVALASVGETTTCSQTTASVLPTPPQSALGPSPAWREVDKFAWEILRSSSASEYLGEFAAVRQGDTGEPQLLDACELADAIEYFLSSPKAALGEVAGSESDPFLANAARKLLDALNAAVEPEFEGVTTDASTVRTLLEGHSLGALSTAAFSAGDLARDSGFFRPSDEWRRFRDAIDLLTATAEFEIPDLASDMAQIVGSQRSIRQLKEICEAVLFVKRAMQLTQEECQRSGGTATDLSALRSKVSEQLGELSALVVSLEREG